MKRINYKNNEDFKDIEATENEMKSVCYTAISFLGFVTILIGGIILVLA